MTVTNVDKALLLAEWDGRGAPSYPTPFCCPCCFAPHGMPPTTNRHEPDCVMDLALSERGFYSQEERDRARYSLPPTPIPHAAPT